MKRARTVEKISKAFVDSAEPADKDRFLFDADLTGFGLKVTPKGRKTYFVQYRLNGRKARYTIGRHGAPWTVNEARTEALRILGEVAKGCDPQAEKRNMRTALTISELCDAYLAEGCDDKKPSTLATDRGRITRHIKPLLGRKSVKDLTANDVKRFMKDVADGKTACDVKTGHRGRARVSGGRGTATRTVGLLGGILSFAVEESLRLDNPVHGVKRYRNQPNERFLSPVELARLGEVLSHMETEGDNPRAISAIRLLILTGCRKTEVLALRWNEVDFESGCLRLADSKTGQKTLILGAPALQLLSKLPQISGTPYVFPAMKGDGHYVGLPKIWQRARKKAGLEDVRLHDLRHSFASVGASAGMGLPIIGKLLGHSDPKTTARYAHIGDDPAKVAADRIAGTIDAALSGTAMGTNAIKST